MPVLSRPMKKRGEQERMATKVEASQISKQQHGLGGGGSIFYRESA